MRLFPRSTSDHREAERTTESTEGKTTDGGVTTDHTDGTDGEKG